MQQQRSDPSTERGGMQNHERLILDPFVVESWRKSPSLYRGLPLQVDPSVYDLKRLAKIAMTMSQQDLFIRVASGAPGAAMPRVTNPTREEDLEARLGTECLSINMSNLQKYDPTIREVLNRFVEVLAPAVQLGPKDIFHPTAAMFLSSPGATSCYHDDRESNFLLHLRGKKHVHVFPSATTTGREVFKACFMRRRGIHSEYQEEFEKTAVVLPMTPGTALYIPRLWPHWVKNGSEISASLSLNFFTYQDFVLEKLYMVNDKLRKVCTQAFARILP